MVALLAMGTATLALAAIDTGTAFGGMGASREMTIMALVEPTVLVSVFALSVRAGSTSLAAIVTATLHDPSRVLSPASLLAAIALGVVTVAETGRLPVDNPATHLELTMVHEAMILEYAGPDLALIELASSMRLVVFLGLLATLFVPWGIATSAAPLAVAGGLAAFAVKVAASRGGAGRRGGVHGEAAAVPRPGAAGRARSCWRCSPSPRPGSWRREAMSQAVYVQLLDLCCGALLLTAVLIVWRRQLPAIIRFFALQGTALAALAAVLAAHGRDARLGGIAGGVLVLRAIALPWLLRRALAAAGPAARRPENGRPGRW